MHPRKHIEELEKHAIESELVSQLAPNPDVRRTNEAQAAKLRSRIDELNRRVRKLMKDHPEELEK